MPCAPCTEPACPIKAPGFHSGDAAKYTRAVDGAVGNTRVSGTVSGTCHLFRLPLGPGPSLHQLARGLRRRLRRLHRDHGEGPTSPARNHRLRPSGLPDRTARYSGRSGESSPGSRTRSFRACRGLRPRGVRWVLAERTLPCCLPCTRPRPSLNWLSRLNAGLHAPLSTLVAVLTGRSAVMGRCDLLSLHQRTSTPTPCRSPGASELPARS